MKIRWKKKRKIYIALVQNVVSLIVFKKLFKLQEIKRKISHFFHLFTLYISEQVVPSASLFGLHSTAEL